MEKLKPLTKHVGMFLIIFGAALAAQWSYDKLNKPKILPPATQQK